MSKPASKSLLKRASDTLNQPFAVPKDIAWAWITLLQSQQDAKPDSDEGRHQRMQELESWIMDLQLPSDPKGVNTQAVSPEAVKNAARMVFEWPHEYIFEAPAKSKHFTEKVIHKDAITQPILDALKDANESDDRALLMSILEGYAKEGREPFGKITEEGIEWKGSNWSEGDKYHLLTLKSLNNRLSNLRKKQLI
ncbi:hypothetical protein SAMN06295945_0979 [Polynucleobacter meluiroseus]|uniref:Uncharacterized protein n=1 Tax=Polynucleobacter meluiroseus TaxID=1938814 RepID=A0A240E1A3_9BURK|nr:hypothetical protein [Polynucleobacter meluiroseus]SNX28640.1 hypothetical protein SAMN06295945_0979 [Polynucleobacter meluiroseus]